MKQMMLVLSVLVFAGSAYSAQELPSFVPKFTQSSGRKLSQALSQYVVKNSAALAKIGAQQNGLSSMTLIGLPRCLGAIGSSSVLVGTCMMAGDLDAPNSSSAIAITIKEVNPGSGEEKVEAVVTVVTSEI